MHRSIYRSAGVSLLILLATVGRLIAGESTAAKNTQPEIVKLTTPEEAARSITVPEGFKVSLFAAEPDVRQPIALTTDSRGRLWVAENNTYAEKPANFDLSQHDRIIILEDADHDGRAERHKVFWDQAQKLTSVEIGFGGVWALCPPRLLFIPDRNGDDIPDGEPQVVLDGWNENEVRHNIANGLKWGPDGWLYGRHGIQATSLVGAPGTPPSQRTPINCGIWRYHPTWKQFEVVCRGTTNSWGMDWNEHGELFFINTVIGHLWHAIPGAHFQRMYGEDDNPHLYELIGQTADHFHWDTAETWNEIRHGVSKSTDQAGGGHAHCGAMIYLGDNWPDRYRGTLFTVNMHGRRLNNDVLGRRGAGYVGRHGADFLKSSDPWFRGIDLVTGPDGGVYLADWSDIGECHEDDGVHRSSGRIFKIVFGKPAATTVGDVAKLSDVELVGLQGHKNDWYARQARQVLQQRSASGHPPEELDRALRAMFASDPDPVHKLRAMWCLHATAGDSEAWLLEQLHHPDEHVRVWAVRLLTDRQAPSVEVVREFSSLAANQPSGLVLLYLASALQRLAPADRWALAERLSEYARFASDPALPLMIWYGVEAGVPDDAAAAVRLAESSYMPQVVRSIARRLTENLPAVPEPIDQLVAVAGKSRSIERSRAILSGMADALRGVRKAPMPASWKSAQKSLDSAADDELKRLVRELSVVFGDGRALEDVMRIAASKSADPASRRDALRVLVEARAKGLAPLLRSLVDERDVGADAVSALAVCDDPGIAEFLIKRFGKLKEPARAAAIVTLSSRPASARSLLEAVAAGTIDRQQVPAFQIRQMASFPGDDIRTRVSTLWPELRPIAAAKKERIEQLKKLLGAAELSAADLSNGRQRFVQACASCHTLFGEGGKIGPDLTGSQRANLDYLLENIVDPSATVTPMYRLSTITLTDGQILSGIVGDRTGPTLAVQTPTQRLVLSREDVEEIQNSDLSLMPEGLLDLLSATEVRDLVAYLMAQRQVPLPAGNRKGPR